jgi:class 3 adenylate cyclase
MMSTTPTRVGGAAALPADCKSLTAGVAFFDLSRLAEWASDAEDEQVAAFLQAFYALAQQALEPAGVRVVKFMGDAGLCTFPVERADDAIGALCDLPEKARELALAFGYDAYLNVNIHAGRILEGSFGTPGAERTDVIGKTVNIAARLGRRGVTLSAQAFRLLSEGARKPFDKIKPPITYRFRGRD